MQYLQILAAVKVVLRVGNRRTTPVYATVNARRPIIMYNHFSNPFPVCTIAVCENKQAVSSCQQTTNKKFFGTRTCGPWQNARANRDTNTANPLLGDIPPSSRDDPSENGRYSYE